MDGAALFVGVGSPHGDDRAGWLVADALSNRARAGCFTPPTDARAGCRGLVIHKASTPADLFDWLDDAATLIVCDAVRGAGPIGSLHRWIWPDARIGRLRASGSHDLCLSEVLEMAGRLDRLPAHVVVWGIEASPVAPVSEVSPEVGQVLAVVAEKIWSELSPAIDI